MHTEESVTQEETENTQNVTGQEEQKALCYVYICGAVVSPGVYEVPEHTRIYEVVELADGFTPEADDTVLNLAENVLDGQKLYIQAGRSNRKSRYGTGCARCGGK